jgi:beta-glucosidase
MREADTQKTVGFFDSEEDCQFEFGLGVYGSAKLFLNGELVIDNATKQTKGSLFFACGTIEEKCIVDLKKGQRYHVKIEFGSAATSKVRQGSNVLSGGGGVRLGGAKVIDADEEVKHAASLAKEVDQVIICAGLNVSLNHTLTNSAYLFVQSDWEGESADRDDMKLPGHMDSRLNLSGLKLALTVFRTHRRSS